MRAEPIGTPAPERRLALVVGIGRSGTSAFTGILRQLGFHVPKPEVRADDTNPRGFNEPRWAVSFHSRLMRGRRVTTFDSRPAAWQMMGEVAEDERVIDELRSWLAVQFVGTDNVVVKDPRIGWFLPLWRRCASDLGVETCFATVLRHPAQVIRSAREWYGTWQNDASRAAAWLNVTLHMEAETRGDRRAFVCYDDLLADWTDQIARVGEALDVPFLVEVDTSRREAVDRFIDPSLRRSVVGWEEVAVPETLLSMLEDVWASVTALARPNGEARNVQAALDRARAAYVQLYADAEAITQSSTRAVKPRRGQGSWTPATPRSGAKRHAWRLARRFARRLPPRQRERLRLALSEGLLEDGVAGLPFRIALLVPPRYRERVPLALVRAGLRLLRAWRR